MPTVRSYLMPSGSPRPPVLLSLLKHARRLVWPEGAAGRLHLSVVKRCLSRLAYAERRRSYVRWVSA